MPKRSVFILIVFLSCRLLSAQLFFNTTEKDSSEFYAKNTILYHARYINFYTSRQADGARQKLYFLKQLVKGSLVLGLYNLTIAYQDSRLEGFSNQLDSLSGHIRLTYRNRGFNMRASRELMAGRLHLNLFYNDYWGAGLGFCTSDFGFKITVSPFATVLDGTVENSRGRIPLAAYSFSGALRYKKSFFQYQRIAPLRPDTSYQNDIYGDIFSIDGQSPLPWQLHIHASASYGSIRAYLKYNHNFYAYLDHFRFFLYSIRLWRDFTEDNRLAVGNNAFFAWSGNESYLEIWPFNFWGQLLASKTRFTKTDMQLNLPFIEYIRYLKIRNAKVPMEGTFHLRWLQLLQKNAFIYKERYFIVYPLLIGYNTFSYSFQPHTDGFFLLSGQLKATFKKWTAVCAVNQLLPVNFNRLKAATDFSGNGAKVSGGFHLSLSLRYLFY